MASAKKSETIEVRLSHEAKTAFMEHCRLEEQTASDAIRLFIDMRIEKRAAPALRKSPHWRTVIAVAVSAALGLGAAAPSLARASQIDRTTFDQLDRNHYGVLSYAEFHAR